jgi:hypothetical protein
METLKKLKTLSINKPFESAEDVPALGIDPDCKDHLSLLEEQFPVTHARLPSGKTIPLVKTMQTSGCERDCN